MKKSSRRNRALLNRLRKEKKAASRQPRNWTLEKLEERNMLSANTGTEIPDAIQAELDRTYAAYSDLTRYTDEQLEAAPMWVVRTELGITEEDLEFYTSLDATLLSLGDGNLFSINTLETDSAEVIAALGGAEFIEYFYPDVGFSIGQRSVPNDPLFSQQWYLQNVGQLVSQPDTVNTYGAWGEDIHALEAWETATGQGVVVAVVDDGFVSGHEDLGMYGTTSWDPTKYNPFIDFDFVDGDAEPFPDINYLNFQTGEIPNFHGTAVAGIIGATGNNGVGMTGVAYGSTLTGIRLIATRSNDVNDLANFDTFAGLALFLNPDEIDVYNNSWGPADNRQLAGPGPLQQQAFVDSVLRGRTGADGFTKLGTIHIWANGNGGENDDYSNFDGMASSPYVISVGAVDHVGAGSSYTEAGSNILIVAPGSSDPSGMLTTDIQGDAGYNEEGIDDLLGRDFLADTDYTSRFNGTSAAAPVVSGVVALMLEAAANNGIELTFSDVRAILAKSARQNQPDDPGWFAGGSYFMNPLTRPSAISGGALRPVEARDSTTWVVDGNLPANNPLLPDVGPGEDPTIPATNPIMDPLLYLDPFTFQGLQDQFGLNAPAPSFVNGAGYSIHPVYGHGYVDAALAVEMAANWNDWVDFVPGVQQYVSSTGTIPFNPISGLVPAGEAVLGRWIPGGIGGEEGFSEFYEEFFEPIEPGPPPVGPFENPDDPRDIPQNSRGSTAQFFAPRDMAIETVELTIDMTVDPDEVDHLRIAIISPDGTVSEFNNHQTDPNASQLPSFIPAASGDSLQFTFTSVRHFGEKGTRETVDVNPNSLTYGLVVDKPWQLVIENYSGESEAILNSFEVTFKGQEVGGGRIQGFAGYDSNGDGVLVMPDSPDWADPTLRDNFVAGATVWLDVDQDGVRDANEPWQMTGADGNYYFDVPANQWQVGIEIPAGFDNLNNPGAGDTTLISGILEVGTDVDPLVPDDQLQGVNFEMVADIVTFSGTVFADVNNDGNPDGEPSLAGRTIYIDLNENGEFDDPNDPFEPTPETYVTQTDVNGDWEIQAPLAPGYYTIAIAPENGFVPSTPASGFYRIYVDPGDVITNLDFGTNPDLGAITGIVFNDINGDGIQDPGELPLEGWDVFIDVNGNGIAGASEPRMTINPADGSFRFEDLPFSYYQIGLVEQEGYSIQATLNQNTPLGTQFHSQVQILPNQAVTGISFAVTEARDYGDLPESYGTTGANAVSHGVLTGHALGTSVSADMVPTVGMDPDPDVDDGLENAGSIFVQGGQAFTLQVRATPDSLGVLYLQGWIDYNNNGMFDASEQLQFRDPTTMAPISDGNGNGRQIRLSQEVTQLVVIAPSDIHADQVAARLRYGEAVSENGQLQFNRATGRADVGEVEDYIISAQKNTVTQTVLAGDYDGSGTVDITDYQVWKSNFGSTSNLAADGNGDGKVDSADYTVWRNNLGASVAAALTAPVVTTESSEDDGDDDASMPAGLFSTIVVAPSTGDEAGEAAGDGNQVETPATAIDYAFEAEEDEEDSIEDLLEELADDDEVHEALAIALEDNYL